MKKLLYIILTIIFSIFIILFFTTRITCEDKKELKPIFKILKEDYIFDNWKLKIKFAKKDKYDNKNRYNSDSFLKLFRHIKENQIFYKTYFKLGFDKNFIITDYDYTQAYTYYNSEKIDYHIEFFKAGLNAIIQKWLYNGCIESPEEMTEIIKSEYKK